MSRLRKAYACSIIGNRAVTIVYAATASKARYQFLLDVGDCYPDLELMDIRVRRNRYGDIVLPDEHRLVADLSRRQRHMISHAYGSDSRTPGYRDRYCTSPSDRDALTLAWEFGLMSGPHGERAYGETPGWSGAMFYLTDLGKEVARSLLPEYPR